MNDCRLDCSDYARVGGAASYKLLALYIYSVLAHSLVQSLWTYIASYVSVEPKNYNRVALVGGGCNSYLTTPIS